MDGGKKEPPPPKKKGCISSKVMSHRVILLHMDIRVYISRRRVRYYSKMKDNRTPSLLRKRKKERERESKRSEKYGYGDPKTGRLNNIGNKCYNIIYKVRRRFCLMPVT